PPPALTRSAESAHFAAPVDRSRARPNNARVAGRDGKPTNLTLERLRRVEREIAVLRRDTNVRLDQTNARLEPVLDVPNRLVGLVAAQGETFDRLNERFDRLTEAILEGRTHIRSA